MKLIKKFVKSNNLLIIFVLIFVNLLFMKFFWEEIFFDKFKVGAVWAEVVALEWKTEQVYQNIINGHNPFAPTNRFFYPFGHISLSNFLFCSVRVYTVSFTSFLEK